MTKKRNTMANLHEFIKSIALDSELFISVHGFNGRFWISNHGRLISKRRERFYLLKTSIDNTGYYCVTLRMTPKKLRIRIHQLVGTHFNEVFNKGVRMTWNHIDGNKLNNHYTNLEHITAKENCTHAALVVYDIKGEKHPAAKLNDDKVKEIYSLKDSGISFHELGRRYKISRSQIRDIINGIAWRHVTCHL